MANQAADGGESVSVNSLTFAYPGECAPTKQVDSLAGTGKSTCRAGDLQTPSLVAASIQSCPHGYFLYVILCDSA